MKVGTDGVLLGAWADVVGDRDILDVGTGTGIVALMVAQRNDEARITAVDIVGDAVREARNNADMSPWGSRIETIECDINDYNPSQAVDHIISNPPYFVDSLHAGDTARTMARHATTLTYEELVVAAERLLRPGGRLSVILPTECAALFRRVAFERLWLCRQMDVRTSEGGAPKRTLMEFVRSAEALMPRCDEMTIHRADGSYSEEYRRLTEEFYLMF